MPLSLCVFEIGGSDLTSKAQRRKDSKKTPVPIVRLKRAEAQSLAVPLLQDTSPSVMHQKPFDICVQISHVRTALQSRPAEHFTTESDGSGDPSAHESWFFVRLNKSITKAICKDLLDALH